VGVTCHQDKMDQDKDLETKGVNMAAKEQWDQESYPIQDLKWWVNKKIMDKANTELVKSKWEILKSKFLLQSMIKKKINTTVKFKVKQTETLQELQKWLLNIKGFNKNSNKWIISKCHQAEKKLQHHCLLKMIWELNICKI